MARCSSPPWCGILSTPVLGAMLSAHNICLRCVCCRHRFMWLPSSYFSRVIVGLSQSKPLTFSSSYTRVSLSALQGLQGLTQSSRCELRPNAAPSCAMPFCWPSVAALWWFVAMFALGAVASDEASFRDALCLHIAADAHRAVDSNGAVCDPMDVRAVRGWPAGGGSDGGEQGPPPLSASFDELYAVGCCPAASTADVACGAAEAQCYTELHRCVSCCIADNSRGRVYVGYNVAALRFHRCVVQCRHSANDAVNQNRFKSLRHHCHGRQGESSAQ